MCFTLHSWYTNLVLIDISPCILFLVHAIDHQDFVTVIDVVFIHWTLYMGHTSAIGVAEQVGVQAGRTSGRLRRTRLIELQK